MQATIDRDAGLSELVKLDTARALASGLGFTEGPVWVAADNCLLFTDIPNNRIYRWRPDGDGLEVYREPSRNANGLTLDRAGRLLACEHSGRQVTRATYGEPETTLVARFDGRRFNSPNDIVEHSSGAIYFTDPTYGLADLYGAQKELPFQGVYRLAPDGAVTCVERGFTQPNGLVFSPDERYLYIGDSADRFVKRFAVEPDGSLSAGEIFVDMRDYQQPGAPDGMRVDTSGRLWTTGRGGVWVVEPSGALLGILCLPELPANIAFGGAGNATIFLPSRTSVFAVDTLVQGVIVGPR